MNVVRIIIIGTVLTLLGALIPLFSLEGAPHQAQTCEAEARVYGNLLIFPDQLAPTRDFGQSHKDYFRSLATPKPQSSFANDGQYIFNVEIDADDADSAFSQLQNLVDGGSMQDAGEISVLGDIKGHAIATFLNGLSAATLGELGRHSRFLREGLSFKKGGSRRIVARFDIENSKLSDTTQTVMLGLYKVDSCDLNQAPGSTSDNPARPYMISFQSPAKTDTVSYFFGPRLRNSWDRLRDGRMGFGPYSTRTRKRNFINGHWDEHYGVDYPDRGDRALLAPYDGTFFAFLKDRGRAGHVLILRHELDDDGDESVVYSVYMHVSKISIPQAVDSPVRAGQQVAVMGTTGRVSRHLHYQIHLPSRGKDIRFSSGTGELTRYNRVFSNTIKVNPADYLSKLNEDCIARKSREVNNAIEMAQVNKFGVLTANMCSQDYESRLARRMTLPRIYNVKKRGDIPKYYPKN